MKLHLPKEFLKAVLTVMAAFVSFTVQAADTISINFRNGTTGQIPEDTTGITETLEGIDASGWQNINATNQTNTSITNQTGAAAGAITIANVANSWESNVDVGTTLDSYIQKGYIDTPNHKEQIYTVAVDHDYWVSDVVFYMSADTTSNRYSSLNVNGTSYYGSEDGTVVGNQAWGATGNPAGVTSYDYNNSFKVTGLIGDLVVKNDYSEGYGDGKPRATLAGLQIIDRTAETVYFTTLGTGETSLVDTTWSLNGGDAAAYNAETMNYLGVNAAAEGSTLVLNSAEEIDLLGIKTGALTLTANANTTLGSVFIDAGAGLEINTAENITVSMGGFSYHDTSTLTKSGAGTLNMGVLSNGKTNVASFNGGITVNAGVLQFTGTSDENWPDDVEPAFVQLLRNVTTTGTGKVQVVGDVNCSNQLQTEASIAIDDNIEVTGNLRINSAGTTTGTAEADGQKYRLWNIATGGTLTVGEQLWLTNKQKLTVNGGSLEAGSIKLGHEENGADGPYPSRIVVESGSLKTGSITFWGSGNSVTMTGGSLEFTGSQAISAENGCSNGTFSISGGTLKATETAWTLTGGNGVTVTVGGVTIDEANTHGITLNSVTLNGAITNNKTLTLENVTVAGNVSLTNSGTLTVNGAYSSNSKIANTNADAVINFNGDVTFSAGSGDTINGVKPGYVITGSATTGGGTTNFTGGEIISGTAESPQVLSLQNGAKVVVGGGTNTTTMTLGQLRLHDGTSTYTETFTVKGNAVVTITGEDSSGTGGSAVVLGHWHDGEGELKVAGGQLNVLNGSIRIGYDSAASFSITEGSANVAKITFRQNEDADRLTLEGGRLNVGKGGIIVESDAVNESYKAYTKVVLTGGTLGALYSEGAENQGWTLDGRLTTTIGTLTVDTTAVNANDSSSGTGATITIEKASTASSGSAITLTGSGALVIKEFVADTGVSTFGQQEGSSATMTVNSLSVNTGASLTANNALTIGGTIKNDGSLTLNGTIYLSGDIDTSFAHREQGSSSYVDVNGEASTGNNGFLKRTSASYWLTQSSDGVTGATITLGEDFATLEGIKVVYQGDSAFQLDTDTNGQRYFSTGSITSTQYYISSGDVEITSGVLSKATGYTLQGGNMKITEGSVSNGSISYTSGSITLDSSATITDLIAATDSTLMGNITGAGTMEVAVADTWGDTITTSADFTGTVYVKSGTKFTYDSANLGSTLKLASGVNMQVNGGGSLTDNLVLETGSHEVHVNGTTSFDVTGSISGEGTFKKMGGDSTVYIKDNATVANYENNKGTTTVQGGEVTNLTASGGTVNVQGGEVTTLNANSGNSNLTGGNTALLKLAGGTVNVQGGSLTDVNYTGSGTLNFKQTNAQQTQYNLGTIASLSANNYQRHLTVDAGVTVKATGLYNNWGMGTITINGALDIDGELKFSTGSNDSTENNILTGSGTVTANTLTIGNVGKYNFSTVNLTVEGETNMTAAMLQITSGTFNYNGKWNGTGGTVNLMGGTINFNYAENPDTASEEINTFNVLDIAGNDESTAQINLADNVKLKVSSNMWLGGSAVINLAEGAELQKGTMAIIGTGNKSTVTDLDTGDSNAFAHDSDDHIVSNASIRMSQDSAATLALKLDKTAVTNTGSGELTVSNSANTITALSAENGNMKLSASMAVDSISAKSGKMVTVTNGNTIAMGGGAVSIGANGADATLTAKSDTALAQLQEDASFTIQDMTLTNTTITAATVDTKVNLQNVEGSTALLSKGAFTLNATPTVGLAPSGESHGTLSYSNGLSIAMDKNASLTLNLDVVNAVAGDAHGTYDLTITLSGFGDGFTVTQDILSMVGFDSTSWLGQALVSQKAEYTVVTEQTPATAGEGGVPTVSYAAGTGASVGSLVITIAGLNVPEPSSATLGLAALMMLCSRRRRKA